MVSQLQNLPVEFSVSNDLRKGEIILRTDIARSWKVKLNKSGKKQFFLGRGLKEFWVANGLAKGDACKFELVENEKNKPPVVNFSRKIYYVFVLVVYVFEINHNHTN